MGVQIFVNGIDRTDYFKRGSLRIQDVVNERSTASLTFIDTEGNIPNLLTANQSSVETDLSGFTPLGSTILRRDLTEHWHGNASLKVFTPGISAYEGVIIGGVSFSPNTKYTGSIRVKGTGTLRFYVEDQSTGLYASPAVDIALTDDWVCYEATIDIGDARGDNLALVVRTKLTQATIFYLDGLQLEQSPHATPWKLGGTSSTLLIGDNVEIWYNDVLVFAGTVFDPDEEALIPGVSNAIIQTVNLVDYHELCDRHIVAESYIDKTAGFIIQDIVSKYLAADGIRTTADNASFLAAYFPSTYSTTSTVLEGPILNRVVFPLVTATQALNDISEITGLQWLVRPDKTLEFFDRAAYRAPWDLTQTSKCRNIQVKRSKANYRNRQYIRAGYDKTDLQTNIKPTPKPDGQSRTFILPYPLAEKPIIKINGIEVAGTNIGIQGIDENKKWYWNKNSNTITQSETEIPLAATDVLEVTYYGLFPIMLLVSNDAGINERAIAEGTSGIYEAIEDKSNIDSINGALHYCNGLLRRYGSFETVITYETEQLGLKAGQIQYVNLPMHNISGEFLISKIELSDPIIRDQNDDILRYNVELVSGETVGGWTQYFRKMVESQKQLNIRDNEIVVRPSLGFDETWTWTESQVNNVYAAPVPADSLYPSETLYPA